jgi:hypothetical protein
MSEQIFNQQELLYISRLLATHVDDLKNNETKQVNQEKFGFVDNIDFATSLNIKSLGASVKANKVEEKTFDMEVNDKEPLIENWNIVDNMVYGDFYNRDYAPDGIQSRTSFVKSIEGDYVYTKNSKYRLGKKDENPHSWIKKIEAGTLHF